MDNSANTKGSNSKLITTIDKKDISRRKFLQVVGVFAVSVGGTGLLSCEQSGTPVFCDDRKKNKPGGTLPDASAGECMGYILVDSRKCQGCLTCMAACSLINEGASSLSLARIQVSVDAFANYPNDVRITQCRQCQAPQCVAACPTGAMMIDSQNGNIRMVDVESCVGCGMCIQACPFEPKRPVVAPHDEYGGDLKSRKCNLCLNAPYHFAEEGGGIEGIRACEALCPMHAIQFSPLMPVQQGNDGYNCNLRTKKWKQLGFDITL